MSEWRKEKSKNVLVIALSGTSNSNPDVGEIVRTNSPGTSNSSIDIPGLVARAVQIATSGG